MHQIGLKAVDDRFTSTEIGAQAGVSIRNLSKGYGAIRALDDVCLDVAKGEFFSILGPSGSGKTTLLNIIAGFITPDSGSLCIAGTDVTLLAPHRREIGVVFQNYALFPHMSVRENIAYPLKARKFPAARMAEKIEWALEVVQLSGYGERRISQLSGGQKQRVALARALVFEPNLILLDEPLSALDKRLRETMQIELRELHRRIGCTMIYVTHDQKEALTMSDRLAVMDEGRIVQIGPPRSIYDQPVSVFVADFVGESTLLPVQRDKKNSVLLGKHVISTGAPVPSEGDLFLALHSERIVPEVAGQTNAGVNVLTVVVKDVVYQGDSLRMLVELGEGQQVVVRQPCHYRNLLRAPKLGETIRIELHPNDVIIVA